MGNAPETAVEVIGYVRVSTGEQAHSGLGLEAQRRRIQAQARANGWNLLALFEDAGVSAKTLERPGLNAALEMLTPGRVLLALKMDRLTRSAGDLLRFQKMVDGRGAAWATVQERIDTTTATGRLMRTLLATLAEWERDTIAERTVAALASKKERGERLGTTPLGYRTEKDEEGSTRLVPVACEMATVLRARELHGLGYSLPSIARTLTHENHSTKRGGRWFATSVSRLLAPRYVESLPVQSLPCESRHG